MLSRCERAEKREEQNNQMLSALQCFCATGGIKDSQIFVLFVRKWRDGREGKETEKEMEGEERCRTITAAPPRRTKQEGQPSWDEAAVRSTTEPLLSSDLHNTWCAAGPCQLVTAAERALSLSLCVCAAILGLNALRQIYELTAFNHSMVFIY